MELAYNMETVIADKFDNMDEIMEVIKDSEALKEHWKNYQSKFSYAEDISYKDTVKVLKEIIKNTKKANKEIEKLEVTTLLSGKYDRNNAIVTIHPGAGGTESQDWAEMLYRMYIRWATKNNYEVKELDYLEGEEAGLKSVTFEIIGENAYGYMKS